MPNRIVREGILSSDRVDALSAPGEVFYRRLMSIVDDHGRFDGRPAMLLAHCFPLRVGADHKRRVREPEIVKWTGECEQNGLVRSYSVAGKPFIELLDFRQQVRSRSKFPDPAPCAASDSRCAADAMQGGKERREQNQQDSGNAQQMLSTCAADATQLIALAHLDGDGVVDVSVVEGGGDKARGRAPPAVVEAPAGVLPETWASWKRHRGKKLTAEAVRLQTKHLAEWAGQGHDPNRIVEEAVANCWQGLHPPDQPKRNGARSHAPPKLAERRAETLDRVTGEGDGRVIEGGAERVGRAAVPALPGHLRKSG